MAGIQLVAERIGVSLDVPGTTQSYNFTQNVAKIQVNNVFAAVANGAANKIIYETRNNNLGGFRWTQETASGDTSGVYKLSRFINDDQTGSTILSFDQNGNAIFSNDVTVNGTINTSLQLPATVVVNGATQTFQYNSNFVSTFTLFNNQAPSISNNSLTTFNIKNSANGGFRFVHTYQLSDSAGLGSLDLKIINNSNVAINLMTFGVDGGGVPVVTSYGTTNLNGNNIFNQGGIGLAAFHGPTTFYGTIDVPDPTTAGHAANKDYVDTTISNYNIQLSGAVSGSGAASTIINTSLSSTLNLASAAQSLVFGNTDLNTLLNIKNSATPSVGNPVTHSVRLLNNLNAGYVFKYIYNSGDIANIGQLKLQLLNSSNTSIDAWSAIINGGGIPEITYSAYSYFNGRNIFNQAGIEFSAFYGPVTFNSTASGQTPTADEHLATKLYVDTTIGSDITAAFASTPITLTGAVTGVNSISNPIFTSLANVVPITGATQTWNFSANSNVNNKIVNTLSPTIGTPSSVAISLVNSAGGGYRSYHELTSTNTSGIGIYKFQLVNSSNVTTDVHSVALVLNVPVFTVNVAAQFSNAIFDGSVIFNSTVLALDPTLPAQVATKGYVDAAIINRPGATVAMQTNGVGTTTTTANVFVKVSGTTTSANLNNFTMPASNRATYTGTSTVMAFISVSLSAAHSGNNNDEVQFAIYKNGTQISESRISQSADNSSMTYSLSARTSMATNDYIEVWAAISSANRTITVRRLIINITT